MRSIVLTVALVLSGCGLAGGDHSCDLRPKSPQCTDWRDLIGPTVTQEALCRTLNAAGGEGTWKAGQACVTTDSVGGCQTNSGVGKQTNWFYPPKTQQEVKDECMSDGTTYVAPN